MKNVECDSPRRNPSFFTGSPVSRKHLIHIAIACFLFIVIRGTLLHTQPPAQPYPKGTPAPQKRATGTPRFQSTQKREPDSLTDFQNTEFYRTLIDNNLFRPLGWTPPRPIEPYSLIGTIIPRDRNTVSPQAIIQATAANKTHIVTIGEKLDANTKVTDIQPKQVTLEKAGVQQTLTLNTDTWLNKRNR